MKFYLKVFLTVLISSSGLIFPQEISKPDTVFSNCLFYNSIYNDGSVIDSNYIAGLIKKTEEAKGEEKVGLLHKLLNGYYFNKPEFSRDLAKLSLDISTEIKNDSLIAFSTHYYALAFNYLKQFRLCEKIYSDALNLEYAKRKKDYRSWVSNNIGICYQSLGEFDKAAAFFYDAILLNEEAGNRAFAGKVYGNLAEVFLRLGKYDESIKNYKESFKYLTEKNDAVVISKNYSNLANIELYKNNKAEAEKYFDQALKIVEALNDTVHILEVTQTYAETLFEQENYQEALKYFTRAKDFCNPENLKNVYFISVLGIGKSYLYLGNIEKAKNALLFARKELNKNNVESALPELELNLSRLYSRLGDWGKFNYHFKKSEEYRLAKIEESEVNTINELKIIYETEKKDQLLESQKIHITDQKKQMWLIFTIALLLLIGFLITLFLRQKLHSAYKVLYEKNIDITQKWNQLQQFYQLQKEKSGSKEKDNLFEKINSRMSSEKLFARSDINLEQLAKKVNSNSKYVSKAIKENAGMNFNQYVNAFRIEEAKKVLLDDETKNWSMEAIAEECGFNNHTTFYKSFKNNTGLTPSVFRDTNIEIEKE